MINSEFQRTIPSRFCGNTLVCLFAFWMRHIFTFHTGQITLFILFTNLSAGEQGGLTFQPLTPKILVPETSNQTFIFNQAADMFIFAVKVFFSCFNFLRPASSGCPANFIFKHLHSYMTGLIQIE